LHRSEASETTHTYLVVPAPNHHERVSQAQDFLGRTVQRHCRRNQPLTIAATPNVDSDINSCIIVNNNKQQRFHHYFHRGTKNNLERGRGVVALEFVDSSNLKSPTRFARRLSNFSLARSAAASSIISEPGGKI
jgi:hypothetical protein